MSGHHPWSELTKHFTAKDREVVEAGAAEIAADSDKRERLAPDRAPASRSARRPDPAPPTRRRPVELGHDR